MKNHIIVISIGVFGLGFPFQQTQGFDELDPVYKVFRSNNAEATLIVASADGKIEKVFNQERSLIRFSPASTFKILNTLIALKLTPISSAESLFKWDGKVRQNLAWNKNHTLNSAFKVSCVWCYQSIAREIGVSKYAEELNAAAYGNRHVSAPVDLFWLNGVVKISASEQIDFLRRLVNNTLPYKLSDTQVLKEIMLVDKNSDYALYAKSGWTGPELETGWYVGYIETSNDTFVFAMNMRMSAAKQAPLRKKLVIESLQALKLI
ncbi:MAG: beta-lactamase class D [Arenicella sp.]|jgi:beta-lactamase class D